MLHSGNIWLIEQPTWSAYARQRMVALLMDARTTKLADDHLLLARPCSARVVKRFAAAKVGSRHQMLGSAQNS